MVRASDSYPPRRTRVQLVIKTWRGSSGGKSVGFITRRPWVQVPSPLQTRPLAMVLLLMSFIVYILYSEIFNKHYTGFSSNLSARLKSHNIYGNDWTKRYRPWKVIFTKEFTTRQEAMKFEKWLKTGAGRDYIKSIQH